MIVAIVVLLALLLVWGLTGRKGASSRADRAVEQSHVVGVAPLVVSSGFRGEIAPGESIAVIAPFDGVVRRLVFAYGDPVEAGQVLLELDPSEVQRVRNEAESAYLKAAQTSADLGNWQSGPEMSRARRSLTSATLELRRTERRLDETRTLLDRGLVPRSEYENLEQQLQMQQMAVEAAQQDMALTSRRGQGGAQRIAALELTNAAERLETLSSEMGSARIAAPDAGIIVLPPASGQTSGDPGVRVGVRLSKGQTLGVIARAGALGVRFQLDESDVNAIKPGQPVTVTGPGFEGLTLRGRIASISGQANGAGEPGSKATFIATALLDPLAPDQARQVRIGMSANIDVLAYSNTRAITVPPQAIQGPMSDALVVVRERAGAGTRKVAIRVGRVAPDRVEVLSGLKPGDVVIWTTARRER